jgi:hypothetical protein
MCNAPTPQISELNLQGYRLIETGEKRAAALLLVELISVNTDKNP